MWILKCTRNRPGIEFILLLRLMGSLSITLKSVAELLRFARLVVPRRIERERNGYKSIIEELI